jgi:hypothetical protein
VALLWEVTADLIDMCPEQPWCDGSIRNALVAIGWFAEAAPPLTVTSGEVRNVSSQHFGPNKVLYWCKHRLVTPGVCRILGIWRDSGEGLPPPPLPLPLDPTFSVVWGPDDTANDLITGLVNEDGEVGHLRPLRLAYRVVRSECGYPADYGSESYRTLRGGALMALAKQQRGGETWLLDYEPLNPGECRVSRLWRDDTEGPLQNHDRWFLASTDRYGYLSYLVVGAVLTRGWNGDSEGEFLRPKGLRLYRVVGLYAVPPEYQPGKGLSR